MTYAHEPWCDKLHSGPEPCPPPRPSYVDYIDTLDRPVAHYVDRLVEQWMVTDARGETFSILNDPEVAERIVGCLQGGQLWYRQIRNTVTGWHLMKTVTLPDPSTVEDSSE